MEFWRNGDCLEVGVQPYSNGNCLDLPKSMFNSHLSVMPAFTLEIAYIKWAYADCNLLVGPKRVSECYAAMLQNIAGGDPAKVIEALDKLLSDAKSSEEASPASWQQQHARSVIITGVVAALCKPLIQKFKIGHCPP